MGWPRMDGKVIVLTGATSGIGRVAADTLAACGATVVAIGRDPQKIAGLGYEGHVADLSSMAEVRRVADVIRARHARIDVLVNNAGALYAKRVVTPEGFEKTFALNHLGYFLLTERLRDRVRERIVNVASAAHLRGSMHWDDLQLQRYPKQGREAYRQSKLANILFTRELARRLAGTGVTANAIHPGFVATNFVRDNGGIPALVMRLTRPLQRTPEQGADTLIWAVTAPELTHVTGQYFSDRRPGTLSREAKDDAAARRLWELSARMVGV